MTGTLLLLQECALFVEYLIFFESVHNTDYVFVSAIMSNILIYTDNYYFRVGLSQMINCILCHDTTDLFYYEITSLSSIDYIFIDAEIKNPLNLLNFLKKKNYYTPMFIVNANTTSKYNTCIPLWYFNILKIEKGTSVDELSLQLREIFNHQDKKTDVVNKIKPCHFTLNKKLSAQQKKILKDLAEGLTCTAIANKMNINYRTVQTHKNRIMKKYKIKTKHELYALLNYFYKNQIQNP